MQKWWTLFLTIILLIMEEKLSALESNSRSNIDEELKYIQNYYQNNLDLELRGRKYLLDPLISSIALKLQRNIQGQALGKGYGIYLFSDPIFIIDLKFYKNLFDIFNVNIHGGWGLVRVSDYNNNSDIRIKLSEIQQLSNIDLASTKDYIINSLQGKLESEELQIYAINKSKLDKFSDYIPTSYHWAYQFGLSINFHNWENQFIGQYIDHEYNQINEDINLKFVCHYVWFISPTLSSLCKSRHVTLPNLQSGSITFAQGMPLINKNIFYFNWSTLYNIHLLSTIYGNASIYFGGYLGILKSLRNNILMDNIQSEKTIETGEAIYTYMPNFGLTFKNEFMVFKFGLNLIEIGFYLKA